MLGGINMKDLFHKDIETLQEKLQLFEAEEIDLKTYKGTSGGFGTYPQRNGLYMLRLRMPGGKITKKQMDFLADSILNHNIERYKITTCQTIQMHDLTSNQVIERMIKAMDSDIYTRGGGGDCTRNVMATPLSGIQPNNTLDVQPYAKAVSDYLLIKAKQLHLPRKLKIAFENNVLNETHATFRDLGFIVQGETFDVYCAGGLGPHPKLGVCVIQGLPKEDVLCAVDAMILLFTRYGNYQNRAKSRTRYLQDQFSCDELQALFQTLLEETKLTSPKLHLECASKPSTHLFHYHPKGGYLSPTTILTIHEMMKTNPEIEMRLSPDGSFYLAHITAEELQQLQQLSDSAQNDFEKSVCCVGGTRCTTGIRDSQALLTAIFHELNLIDTTYLPKLHISGCPSSCGTHQSAMLGLQGGVKVIDKKPVPAYRIVYKGSSLFAKEQLAQESEFMPETTIPTFLKELAKLLNQAQLPFATWLQTNEDTFIQLIQQYANIIID